MLCKVEKKHFFTLKSTFFFVFEDCPVLAKGSIQNIHIFKQSALICKATATLKGVGLWEVSFL